MRVFHNNGTRNHFPSQDSLKRSQRLRIKIWQPTPEKYSLGSESENVNLKDRGAEYINTSEGARSNFSPMHNQNAYPAEKDEDLESNACLKPPSPAMELWILR